MLRRRFYQSYKSPINNGVYAVRQDGRLTPLSRSVNNALSAIGGQQLTKDYYLSSSEYDIQ